MSNIENADPSLAGPTGQPRTWDFMETLFVVLVAYLAYIIAGMLILTFILSIPSTMKGLSSEQIDTLWKQENWQRAGNILATPAAVAVLWVAIRKAGREFSEYLALNWPRPGELLSALGIMVVVFVLECAFTYVAAGPQAPATNTYIAVGGAGGLLVMLVAGCIAAPVLEELVVRGFMFRGWSQTFLGPIGAIVLTSALWGMNHTQYDWLGRLNIFFMGLALGYFRWRSNSTWLPVMIHSTFNTAIFFMMGPYA